MVHELLPSATVSRTARRFSWPLPKYCKEVHRTRNVPKGIHQPLEFPGMCMTGARSFASFARIDEPRVRFALHRRHAKHLQGVALWSCPGISINIFHPQRRSAHEDTRLIKTHEYYRYIYHKPCLT